MKQRRKKPTSNKQQTVAVTSLLYHLGCWHAPVIHAMNMLATLKSSTFEAKHVNSKAERLPMYKTKAVLVKRIDGFHIDSVEENFNESTILYFIKGASPHSHPQLPSEYGSILKFSKAERWGLWTGCILLSLLGSNANGANSCACGWTNLWSSHG